LRCFQNGASNIAGSEGPYRGGKASILEGGHRVPGLMEWPAKIPTNRVLKEVVAGLDLPVTFRTIFHSETSEEPDPQRLDPLMDGISLFPSLFNTQNWIRPKPFGICRPAQDGHQLFCTEFAVMKFPWKLTSTLALDQMSLFNVDQDPGEFNDVSKMNEEVFVSLKEFATGWIDDLRKAYHQNCPTLVRRLKNLKRAIPVRAEMAPRKRNQ
jgi:arylsulfatase A-like enzyme